MSDVRIQMGVLQNMRRKVYDMTRDSKYSHDARMALHDVAIEITKYIDELIDNS